MESSYKHIIEKEPGGCQVLVFPHLLLNIRIRRIPVLLSRDLFCRRALKRGGEVVANGDDCSGCAVIVDPFAVSYGHADAAVGCRFPEFVVFLCRNIIDAGGLSRNAVERMLVFPSLEQYCP